jgi:hypothetical protein
MQAAQRSSDSVMQMIDTQSDFTKEKQQQADLPNEKNAGHELGQLANKLLINFWSNTLNCALGPNDKRLEYATREELKKVVNEISQYREAMKKAKAEITAKCHELKFAKIPKALRARIESRIHYSGLLQLHACAELGERKKASKKEAENIKSLCGLSEEDFNQKFSNTKRRIFYEIIEKHMGCERVAEIQKEAEERAWVVIRARARERAELH